MFVSLIDVPCQTNIVLKESDNSFTRPSPSPLIQEEIEPHLTQNRLLEPVLSIHIPSHLPSYFKLYLDNNA